MAKGHVGPYQLDLYSSMRTHIYKRNRWRRARPRRLAGMDVGHLPYMWPHTAIYTALYVASYWYIDCYICVLRRNRWRTAWAKAPFFVL
jgi:hypothetical protein